MILQPRQRKVFEETLAATLEVLPPLEYLEALSVVHPGIGPRVAELRTQREFLRTLAETAVELDRVSQEG